MADDGGVDDPDPPFEEATMFAHVCTACQERKLVFPSQLTSLINRPHGIEVTFTCWCGAEQQLVTGRAAEAPRRTLTAA